MNQYRISFYDYNAIDPRDRDQIQRTIVNAKDEAEAREIFSFTNCEVVSLEIVAVIVSIPSDEDDTTGYSFKGKITNIKLHDHALTMDEIKAEYYTDYGRDYQEHNDLYIVGNGE